MNSAQTTNGARTYDPLLIKLKEKYSLKEIPHSSGYLTLQETDQAESGSVLPYMGGHCRVFAFHSRESKGFSVSLYMTNYFLPYTIILTNKTLKMTRCCIVFFVRGICSDELYYLVPLILTFTKMSPHCSEMPLFPSHFFGET